MAHDNVLARVGPGEERVYEYDLDARTGSSLLLYHPHADGSVTSQVAGGMAGALSIVDAHQERASGLGVQRELLVLQALSFDRAPGSDSNTRTVPWVPPAARRVPPR